MEAKNIHERRAYVIALRCLEHWLDGDNMKYEFPETIAKIEEIVQSLEKERDSYWPEEQETKR